MLIESLNANKIRWDSLMSLLKQVPGYDGRNFNGVSDEEREIIKELEKCNEEYKRLRIAYANSNFAG
jgi:hypothetical protein